MNKNCPEKGTPVHTTTPPKAAPQHMPIASDQSTKANGVSTNIYPPTRIRRHYSLNIGNMNLKPCYPYLIRAAYQPTNHSDPITLICDHC